MKLRFTIPALADLHSILDDMAARSPLGAKRVQRRIQKIVEILTDHPYIGVRSEDPAIRRLTTTPYPYLVFYEATNIEIVVHAIRQAVRDPSGMPGSP